MGDESQYGASKSVSAKPALDTSSCQRMWDELVRESPVNRLRFLDAVLARGGEVDKGMVAELIREAGAKACVADPDVVGLVRQLFGEPGVQRLKQRAGA